MFCDVVLSKDHNGNWMVFYAPYCDGPEEGEWFNIADNGVMHLWKCERLLKGITKDDAVWNAICDLAGVEAERITSIIHEQKLFYNEEEKF